MNKCQRLDQRCPSPHFRFLAHGPWVLIIHRDILQLDQLSAGFALTGLELAVVSTVVINDRGRQMKAKAIQRLCGDHGMPPLFSRPRKPNDNPFIESAFSKAKRALEYPGRFLDDCEAVTYFTQYFNWYDTEHYHSGLASSPSS